MLAADFISILAKLPRQPRASIHSAAQAVITVCTDLHFCSCQPFTLFMHRSLTAVKNRSVDFKQVCMIPLQYILQLHQSFLTSYPSSSVMSSIGKCTDIALPVGGSRANQFIIISIPIFPTLNQ